MIRSIVPGALCVCSVASTRCPVSAAVSAVAIVSRSRISPTRITSGSWRSAARRASANPVRVLADLALVDDAAVVRVQKLDRILDRQDVLRARPVDLVDHRRERRRLSGSGRARDENEATRPDGELTQDGGQPELVRRLDPIRDQAERRSERLALEVDVDAEAGEAGHGMREVELARDLELLLLFGRKDAVDELECVVGASAARCRRAAGAPRARETPARSRPSGEGPTHRGRRSARAACRLRAACPAWCVRPIGGATRCFSHAATNPPFRGLRPAQLARLGERRAAGSCSGGDRRVAATRRPS